MSKIIATIEATAEHDLEVIKEAFKKFVDFLEGKDHPVNKLTVHVTTPTGTQTITAAPTPEPAATETAVTPVNNPGEPS